MPTKPLKHGYHAPNIRCPFCPKTKTITLPTSEVATRMGFAEFATICPICGNENYFEVYNGVLQLVCSKDCSMPSTSILSSNDLFPTDECETCRKPYDKHGVGESCYNTTESSLPSSLLSLFKPRLAKVVGLRMVERCEWCKRIEEDHDEGDKGERWCRHSYLPKEEHLSGRSYKPVQEVEVEVK